MPSARGTSAAPAENSARVFEQVGCTASLAGDLESVFVNFTRSAGHAPSQNTVSSSKGPHRDARAFRDESSSPSALSLSLSPTHRLARPVFAGYDTQDSPLEPTPVDVEQLRALNSVVKNPRRDATLLFDAHENGVSLASLSSFSQHAGLDWSRIEETMESVPEEPQDTSRVPLNESQVRIGDWKKTTTRDTSRRQNDDLALLSRLFSAATALAS